MFASIKINSKEKYDHIYKIKCIIFDKLNVGKQEVLLDSGF